MPDLSALIEQRSQLSARSGQLRDSAALLFNRKGRVEEAEAALSNHDAVAALAMQTWAEGGGVGDAPATDHKRRAELVEDVKRASNDLASAGTALAALQSQASVVNTELESVCGVIEAHALDQLEIEHKAEVATYLRLIERQVAPALRRISSLSVMLSEKGQRLASTNRPAAVPLYSRAQRLAEMLYAGIPGKHGPIEFGDLDTEYWTRRLAAIEAGQTPEPSGPKPSFDLGRWGMSNAGEGSIGSADVVPLRQGAA